MIELGMKAVGNDRQKAPPLSLSYFFLPKTITIRYCRKRERRRYFGNIGNETIRSKNMRLRSKIMKTIFQKRKTCQTVERKNSHIT